MKEKGFLDRMAVWAIENRAATEEILFFLFFILSIVLVILAWKAFLLVSLVIGGIVVFLYGCAQLADLVARKIYNYARNRLFGKDFKGAISL